MIRLETCLSLHYETEAEKADVKRVISIAKTIMSVTIPMPTVTVAENEGHLFISGTAQEISLLNTIFHNTLQLENFNDAQFSMNAVGPEQQSSGTTISFDDEIPFETTQPQPSEHSTYYSRYAEEEEDDEEDPFDISDSDEYEDDDETDNPLRLVNSPSSLDFDEPSTDERHSLAEAERSLAGEHHGSSAVWNDVYDRLHDVPRPTASASGSFTSEEQITYSEHHNPRHWNLVKVTYGGSRYYLSYLVPPCANIETELRIRGGIHAEDRPDVQEICVYNTEPYWRELRHLMHQHVESLREAVPA